MNVRACVCCAHACALLFVNMCAPACFSLTNMHCSWDAGQQGGSSSSVLTELQRSTPAALSATCMLLCPSMHALLVRAYATHASAWLRKCVCVFQPHSNSPQRSAGVLFLTVAAPMHPPPNRLKAQALMPPTLHPILACFSQVGSHAPYALMCARASSSGPHAPPSHPHSS